MKHLKKFENYNSEDLIDYVDFGLIEEIFEENYHIDFDEAIYLQPSLIWDNIDNKGFVEDFERDYLENQSLEDIDEDEIKKYILNNLSNDKKEKIREIYLENNEGEDEEDLYEADEYEYMLDEFDDDEIRKVAEEDEDGYDIVQNIMSGSYEGYSAQDIIEEFYGIDPHFYNNRKNTYSFRDTFDDDFKHLKSIVINYIDKQGVEEDWKNSEDDDYKKEFAADYIEQSPKMQKNIIANAPNKVFELFELIENSDKNIGDTYDFQKTYIEQSVEENPEGYEDDEIIANAIFDLYKTFGLNPKIEKEYPNDLMLITTDKYNV